MFDDLDLFEKQLKEIKPRHLSGQLRDRIARKIEGPAQAGDEAGRTACQYTRSGLLYAGIAAALLVALGSWYLAVNRNGRTILPENALASRTTQPEAASPEAERSVTADTYLLRSRDEGIMFTGNSRPVRKIKCSLLDTVQWNEPEDRSRYRMMSTRDVIAYVPVRID